MDNQLLLLAEKSKSHLFVDNISKTMTGRTFHHHYHILYDIRTLLGPTEKTYMEIGVFDGASLALLLQHEYKTNLIGIDIFQFDGQYERVTDNIKKFNIFNRQVTILNNNSHDKIFVDTLPKTDILFIDGDHSCQGVILDFELFSPLVNSGGYIIFDDYHDTVYSPEVKIAVDIIVDRIKTGYYGQYIIIGSMENKLCVTPADLKEYNEFILLKV